MIAMAMAQTTTLQIPFYGYDNFAIDASIIAVQDSVTTLTLACPPGTDASDCGLFPAQTLTYGPSTYRMDTGEGDSFTGYQICQASVCTESAGGSSANFPGSSTTTYDEVDTMPVTVTGGVALLSGGGGAGATTTSATSTQSPTTGGSASRTTASVTQLTGTAMSSSETGAASQTSSAAAQTSSGAASRSDIIGGGLVGGAIGVLGFWFS